VDLAEGLLDVACVFCEIVRGVEPASIVWEDQLTLAAVDLRQFHPGHTLVIPRRHLADIRDLDFETGAALMATVSRVTRAVAAAFPNDGLSLWHSIGKGADQEVPHLHVHVHPRRLGDALLRIYPSAAALPDRSTLDRYAMTLRQQIEMVGTRI
jgi:histidine triad (HIT) family protein